MVNVCHATHPPKKWNIPQNRQATITGSKAKLPHRLGPTGQIALELQRAVRDARASDDAPLKDLFAGDTGTGKSTLAQFLIRELGIDSKWSVKKYSGVDADLEKVRAIAADLDYKDL